MKRSGGGSVINMSSATGISGSNNGTSSYCASKGGIAGLTKAAALEFRAANVILYLASDESRHVTGGEFVVDGGYLAA
jgi:NAD(P)-dependent dehydrogenase (short-subunit alcohol dehydrogenase family)